MSADRPGTGLDGAAPAVSFVLIFKDEERFIGEAIESVVAQTFTDWELLLVDDGSTDHSTSIAEKWVATDPRAHPVPRPRGPPQPGHERLP